MDILLWHEILEPYELAVKELQVKFRHLIKEHHGKGLYSPIESVSGRVKSVSSILEKMQRKHIPMDKMEEEIKNADIVVTGEGRLDHQTAMGKAPVGVAKLGKKYGAKTIAFAGSVTKEAVACNEAGIDAFFPIVRGISTLEEAMDPDTAKANMAAAAEQVFRLL